MSNKLEACVAEMSAELNAASNEAATRLHIIDRILFELLEWPRAEVAPEEPSGSGGWLDYAIGIRSSPQLVVEAKRASTSFQFRTSSSHRTVALQYARSNYGSEVGAVIKQALYYCADVGAPLFAATNGHQWLISIAQWPGVRREHINCILFHDLEDIAKNFSLFSELLGPAGVRKQAAVDRLIDKDALTPSFAASVNTAKPPRPVENPTNYALAPLEVVIHHAFGAIDPDQMGAEAFERCYVTSELDEGYVARVSLFAGKTLPDPARNAQKVNRSHFARDPLNSVDGQRLKLTGEILLLVGGVGSGKSSFTKYALHRIRSSIGKDSEWITLRADLMRHTQVTATTFNHDTFKREVVQSLLDQAEQLGGDLDPFNESVLRGSYSKEIQRARKLDPQAEAVSKRVTEDAHAKPEEHLRHYIRYVTSERGTPVTIAIDNADQGSEALEKFAYSLAQELSEAGACVIVALRETTYARGRQGGFLDVASHTTIAISPPPVKSVLGRRIEFALASLGNNGSLRQKVTVSLRGFPYERITDFVEVLNNELLDPQNTDTVDAVQGLSGTNVRKALEYVHAFMTSAHTPVDELLTQQAGTALNRAQRRLRPEEIFTTFIRCVMKGDLTRYRDAGGLIANIFRVPADTRRSHFIAVRVAQYLGSRVEQDPDVDASDLYASLASLGMRARDVAETLRWLVDRGLVVSRSHPDSPMVAEATLRTTSALTYYVDSLIFNQEYIDNVADDTIVYDKSCADDMLAIQNDQSRQSGARREGKRARFLRYLIDSESAEIKSMPAGARKWCRPIAQEIAVRFFGSDYARVLVRKSRRS